MKKNPAQVEKIWEIFKQVKVNIPLLDAIDQVPSYAKFLKDLCTRKHSTHVPKKVYLAANVTEMLSKPLPTKLKDPGCPTISCTIGGTFIDRALLDLGAGVNLLPYSVYKQLGVGELKPTKITLQLADRSIKIPKGEIEDVLIKVGNFIFPVDFIVLETVPVDNARGQIPVILGRPFLATSNAMINCRNGCMKLTFGNMTIDLNIFNLGKQLMDPSDQPFDVNLIEGIPSEHFENDIQSKFIQSKVEEEYDEVEQWFNAVEPQEDFISSFHWASISEPLEDEKVTEDEPNNDKSPKLELKPLPENLKYAYLGEEETLPVIIAADLSI